MRVRLEVFWLAVGSLVACGAPAARTDTSRERARAELPATCPDPTEGQEVDVRAYALVGVHDGVRFFTGTRAGRPGLVWLREDSTIGFVAIELDGLTCDAESERAIRCFRGPVAELDGTITPLRTVRVELSEPPRVGAVERWEGGPLQAVVSAASDGRHALVVYRDLEGARSHLVTLWNVSGGRLLESSEPIEGELEPVVAWCDGSCTFVARHRDARGPHVITIGAPGFERRSLRDATTVDLVALRSGDSWIVASLDLQGYLHLVAMAGDRTVRAQPPPTARLGATGRLTALDEGLLGARDDAGWSALEISPTAEIVSRTSLETDAVGLKAARVGPGLALAALSGEVRYDESGDYAFHSWTFSATERFVEAGETTEWRSLLGSTPSAGDGRGGYEVEWLTRPGRAAALLMSTGDAGGASRLIPVRRACE